MSKPLAAIIRFNGDPDDLAERFERARELWIEAEGPDHEPLVFCSAGTSGPRLMRCGVVERSSRDDCHAGARTPAPPVRRAAGACVG